MESKQDETMVYVEKVEPAGSESDLAISNQTTVNNKPVGAWQEVGRHPRIAFWCLFFAFSSVSWGFDAQVNGAMVSVPAFRQQFGDLFSGQSVIPARWLIAFNNISSVGQFLGAFFCSWFADRAGRRLALLVGIVVATAGIFGQVFSTARLAFLLSKLILGLGLGFYLTLGPLYASELAPVSLRGIVTGGTNLAICIGQLTSTAAIRGFGTRTDLWAFRGPFAVQWLFPFILIVGLPFAPESPWYHVRKRNLDAAQRSLQQLYPDGSDIGETLARIQKTVNEEEDLVRSARLIHCFQGTNLVRTVISVGVFACQHLSGIIFALGFSSYFFELAGISTEQAFDLGVGVTAIGVIGTVLAWGLMNSFGRRRLFLIGMVGMTLVMLLMGIIDVVNTKPARWVEASCTIVYALFYQVTIGTLAFAILGEASTPSLRAKTVGLATACQAVFGIFFNSVIPLMLLPTEANWKGKVGFIFGGCSLLATVWAYFYVPELKNRTFAEIDLMFQRKIKPRHMAEYKIEPSHSS